jgi:hypothetical protein
VPDLALARVRRGALQPVLDHSLGQLLAGLVCRSMRSAMTPFRSGNLRFTGHPAAPNPSELPVMMQWGRVRSFTAVPLYAGTAVTYTPDSGQLR